MYFLRSPRIHIIGQHIFRIHIFSPVISKYGEVYGSDVSTLIAAFNKERSPEVFEGSTLPSRKRTSSVTNSFIRNSCQSIGTLDLSPYQPLGGYNRNRSASSQRWVILYCFPFFS